VLTLRNRAVVALLTVAILIFGLISAGSLKQELKGAHRRRGVQRIHR
jgi:hypothetical protein